MTAPASRISLRRCAARLLPATLFNGAVLVLASAVFVSTWTTYDLALSLPRVISFVFGLALFFAAAALSQTRRGLLAGLLLFVSVGIGFALLGWVGIRWSLDDEIKIPLFSPFIQRFPELYRQFPQVLSDGFSPNIIAGSLLWVLFPTLGLLRMLFSKHGWQFFFRAAVPGWVRVGLCLFLTAALLLMTAMILLCQSRSAYLSLLVALLVFIILALQGRARRLVLALTAGGAGGILLLLAPYVARLSQGNVLRGFARLYPVLATDTFLARIANWPYALELIREFPLTGLGLNTFRYVVFQLFPLFCASPVCDIHHAHNELLQVSVELGLPALTAFLWLYAASFRMLRQVYLGAGSSEQTPSALQFLALGLGCGLLPTFCSV